jgi:hypothetical protein
VILVSSALWPILNLIIGLQVLPCLSSRFVQQPPSRVICFLLLRKVPIGFFDMAISNWHLLMTSVCLHHRGPDAPVCFRRSDKRCRRCRGIKINGFANAAQNYRMLERKTWCHGRVPALGNCPPMQGFSPKWSISDLSTVQFQHHPMLSMQSQAPAAYIEQTLLRILTEIEKRPSGHPKVVLRRIVRDRSTSQHVTEREITYCWPGRNREEAWRFGNAALDFFKRWCVLSDTPVQRALGRSWRRYTMPWKETSR